MSYGERADRDWRRVGAPHGKEHRDHVWMKDMVDRPARGTAMLGPVGTRGGEPHSRAIFASDKNQSHTDPGRWSSGFLNRTYCAYNRTYFEEIQALAFGRVPPQNTGPDAAA